jgi:hypothetical protein
MKALERYIKSKEGDKVSMAVTSVNLTKAQLDFIKKKNVNLSAIVRDLVEDLMKRK